MNFIEILPINIYKAIFISSPFIAFGITGILWQNDKLKYTLFDKILQYGVAFSVLYCATNTTLFLFCLWLKLVWSLF